MISRPGEFPLLVICCLWLYRITRYRNTPMSEIPRSPRWTAAVISAVVIAIAIIALYR